MDKVLDKKKIRHIAYQREIHKQNPHFDTKKEKKERLLKIKRELYRKL